METASYLIRKSIWNLTFTLVLFSGGKGYSQSDDQRPNILFILTDDMGYTDLPAYGNPFQEAPNLDFLAKNGLKFTDAYSSSPVCSPSRAGFITGIHSTRYHLTNFIAGNRKADTVAIDPAKWNPFLAGNQVTVAELFKEKGYQTAMIGKWHLGNAEDQTPWSQGFDFSRMIGKNGLDYYNYSIFEDSYKNVFLDSGKHYLTDQLTGYALDFLEKRPNEKPFFLFLSYSAPHVFIVPRGDKVSKYLRKYEQFEGKYNPYYAAMIESVDDGIGLILEKLKFQGLDKNTLIVFTSDNGGVGLPELGPIPADLDPLRKWKGHPYEGGIRVPLLAYWPEKIKPGVTSFATTNLDFAPTFAEIAGLAPQNAWDGQSLTSVLFGNRSASREGAMYWHYPHFSNQLGKPAAAVRQGVWKLILHYENQATELYNLDEDISESMDLKAKHPEKAKELYELLYRWLNDTEANLPIDKKTGQPLVLEPSL
ncbi:sulfatase [Algoriphagus jejuensis]|uniref:Sulfatase n=1 Tax=Algoriphagus jejuensis TaxID=419934 RepID=A0ABP3YFE6_9BACT